jgi:hypothetical protein
VVSLVRQLPIWFVGMMAALFGRLYVHWQHGDLGFGSFLAAGISLLIVVAWTVVIILGLNVLRFLWAGALRKQLARRQDADVGDPGSHAVRVPPGHDRVVTRLNVGRGRRKIPPPVGCL